MKVDIHKILVPTDFSESTQAVLSFATSLARDNDATLLIAHAIDIQQPATAAPIASGVPTPPLPIPDRETEKELLEQVRPADEQVNYEHRLVDGSPIDAILQLVEDEGVDLVVMGTHGRTGLMRLLMGSVAEAVVRRATCPVLTFRPAVVKQAATGDDPDVATASDDPPPGQAKMHESLDSTETESKQDDQQYLG